MNFRDPQDLHRTLTTLESLNGKLTRYYLKRDIKCAPYGNRLVPQPSLCPLWVISGHKVNDICGNLGVISREATHPLLTLV